MSERITPVEKLSLRWRAIRALSSVALATIIVTGMPIDGENKVSAVPAKDTYKMAVLGASIADGNQVLSANEFSAADKREYMADTAAEMIEDATRGTLDVEVTNFNYYVVNPLQKNDRCKSENVSVFEESFIEQTKQSAQKDGYREGEYYETVILTDFPACPRDFMDNSSFVPGGLAMENNTSLIFSSDPETILHETAHQLGLGHASRAFCDEFGHFKGDEKCRLGSREEYGDGNSIMGSSPNRLGYQDPDPLNAYELLSRGLLREEDIVVARESGTYKISPLFGIGNKRAIQIPGVIRHPGIKSMDPALTDYLIELSSPEGAVCAVNGEPKTSIGPCKAAEALTLRIYATPNDLSTVENRKRSVLMVADQLEGLPSSDGKEEWLPFFNDDLSGVRIEIPTDQAYSRFFDKDSFTIAIRQTFPKDRLWRRGLHFVPSNLR